MTVHPRPVATADLRAESAKLRPLGGMVSCHLGREGLDRPVVKFLVGQIELWGFFGRSRWTCNLPVPSRACPHAPVPRQRRCWI